MVSTEEQNQTSSKKRRVRRKKLKLAVQATDTFFTSYFKNIGNPSLKNTIHINLPFVEQDLHLEQDLSVKNGEDLCNVSLPNNNILKTKNMSSKDVTAQSRDEVKAAREAKKLAKQKAKNKGDAQSSDKITTETVPLKSDIAKSPSSKDKTQSELSAKSIDEVDRANIKLDTIKIADTSKESKEQILIDRSAKKAAKQAKKKAESDFKSSIDTTKHDVGDLKSNVKTTGQDVGGLKSKPDMTVKDVVETLKDIKQVAKDVQDLTAKVSAISFEAKEADSDKSKADLKAERRAKQEAQRAAKQAALEQKSAQTKAKDAPVTEKEIVIQKDVVKEKSPKPKSEKPKVKPQAASRVNWFQHLHTQLDKDALNKIPINSNLHPAIIKLGVRLATRVVTGSNARCVATLDALKQMVRDYTLPAKTEFARGLESHLTASLQFLWSMRQPTASQTNAIKYFRHHLTRLPNNVDEFDAKKKLQEEIDKYIEDQIDKAGEAISEAVRHKIAAGDNILTYGCSSLIERILREAWDAGVQFRTIVVGNRVHNGAREMLRRLTVAGLHCTYADITAVSYVMKSINKVILGASSLLVNGSVLGAVGTAQVALAAKECNVPLLVACETHKFSEKVQTDAFVYNELGDPDELLDQSDAGSPSPLRDWRSTPNLTLLNLSYDVTPPSLVTAVVTEKAILPCTSAPVVLRTKLSEYGM